MKTTVGILGRKGQGSVEYLMTYGWVILVVMLVGIVLWRFGVFSPAQGTMGFSGFGAVKPIDHVSPKSGNLNVVFMNGAGAMINMNVSVGDIKVIVGWINTNDDVMVSFSGLSGVCDPGMNSYNVNMNATYYNSISGLKHTDSGRVWGPC